MVYLVVSNALLARGLRRSGVPHFGWANTVTAARSSLVGVVTALVATSFTLRSRCRSSSASRSRPRAGRRRRLGRPAHAHRERAGCPLRHGGRRVPAARPRRLRRAGSRVVGPPHRRAPLPLHRRGMGAAVDAGRPAAALLAQGRDGVRRASRSWPRHPVSSRSGSSSTSRSRRSACCWSPSGGMSCGSCARTHRRSRPFRGARESSPSEGCRTTRARAGLRESDRRRRNGWIAPTGSTSR